jgi:hypothetical protein
MILKKTWIRRVRKMQGRLMLWRWLYVLWSVYHRNGVSSRCVGSSEYHNARARSDKLLCGWPYRDHFLEAWPCKTPIPNKCQIGLRRTDVGWWRNVTGCRQAPLCVLLLGAVVSRLQWLAAGRELAALQWYAALTLEALGRNKYSQKVWIFYFANYTTTWQHQAD